MSLESEAPRRRSDFYPFRACCYLLLLLLLLNLVGPPYTLNRVIKPRLIPPCSSVTRTITLTLGLTPTLTLIKTEYWDRAGGGGNMSYDW